MSEGGQYHIRDNHSEIEQLRSRIEADEALMRTALAALEWEISGYSEDAVPDETASAITALRKRLESSNG